MPTRFRFAAAVAVAVALLALVVAAGGPSARAQNSAIIVQSTTSTDNSGLYDHLLPLFTAATGVDAAVVAVGTGQAIRNARACDGDVLLTHARRREEAFVAEGYGETRHDVMYNDFVIVGPQTDQAGISGVDAAAAALAAIAEAEAAFVSRADDSGTHLAERALWNAAGIDPSAASGGWYLETGQGMGATLNVAVGLGAHTLTDRATWLSFANRADLVILVEGDPALFNQYGVIAVSARRCPTANVDGAQAFVDWLLSEQGQAAIAEHRVDGQQLFFANAAR